MSHSLLVVSALALSACGKTAEPPKQSAWMLEIHDAGSAATLEVPPDQPEMLRVRITRATVPTDFNIQLRKTGLVVAASDSLTLSFRARADQSRKISYGVAMAHAPWESLGFYQEASIGPEWRELTIPFVLSAADANAQLMFNLGASAVPVDLDKIVLRRMPSGDVVKF